VVSAQHVNPWAPLVHRWYVANRRDLPWRRPGFPAWGTLVSEFMLQQTQVSRVIPRLEEWLRRWPSPADLAATPPGEAVRAWDRLGYPRRALALHSAAVAITERHDGEVPTDVDALLALPGVGPYTARAIAVFAYGLRHPVVDTNVRRVIARAVLGQGQAGPAATARDLAAMDALLPADEPEAAVFNAGMMELGAIVCTARDPKCGACPLAGLCHWRALGHPEYTGPRAARQARYAGSDREARGRLLAVLRNSELPVPEDGLLEAVPDETRRRRCLDGLVADGLAVRSSGGYALP
jgi:A/G-specific adenine glycosylase